jgi:hypothetical protein
MQRKRLKCHVVATEHSPYLISLGEQSWDSSLEMYLTLENIWAFEWSHQPIAGCKLFWRGGEILGKLAVIGGEKFLQKRLICKLTASM